MSTALLRLSLGANVALICEGCVLGTGHNVATVGVRVALGTAVALIAVGV